VRFQETIDVLPDLWQPVDNVVHFRQIGIVANLDVEKTATKVAREEALNWFHVVGTQHPAEVVMQLKIGCRSA